MVIYQIYYYQVIAGCQCVYSVASLGRMRETEGREEWKNANYDCSAGDAKRYVLQEAMNFPASMVNLERKGIPWGVSGEREAKSLADFQKDCFQ
jgi:hypothetical protein